ncbi:hypothetical protein JI664_04080 [Rhodobacter sp. NTK016B]|uniref:hypothetical protein n=1 Tax=Rhodobacter sp. NTK016B TaxID=2759676 RepID=UPI001A8F8ADB|nr:hypothetical protein [Rhodobacter sp. NTK016B]MBN8291137.1 hypothetical protein [Rhodobacter sp. NTK016B]
MAEHKILFLGDSHSHCIRDALAQGLADTQGCTVSVDRIQSVKNGKVIGDRSLNEIIEACKDLTPDDLLVSVIGGNQHSVTGLVQHDVPFDILEPDEPAPTDASGVTYVPRSSVFATFERGLRSNDCQRILQLAKAGPQQTVHMAAPPPKEDDAHIMKRFETKFIEMGLAERGLSPKPLRRKLWRIQNDALRKILSEDDIELLMPPAETVTESGFLEPAFYANDATHANPAYGALLIEQAVAWIKARQSAANPA